MNLTHARRGVDGELELRAQEVSAAIQDLPAERQQAVWDELSRAAAEYEQNGRVDPLLHFVTSLLATARLYRNPAYRKAADSVALDRADTEPVDITAWMAERGVTRSSR